jgi:hypothetical protein
MEGTVPIASKLGFYEDFSGFSEGDIPYTGAKITTPRVNYYTNYRVEIELMTQSWMNGTTIAIGC